jgi:acyl-CoA reductase-like NAD-dependent aldehyde dehydrogenase
MTATAGTGSVTSVTTHYIDGAFVESHGRQVIDIINPTRGDVIARVTMADEEGFKYSGVGREYGRYDIEAFLETRAILES